MTIAEELVQLVAKVARDRCAEGDLHEGVALVADLGLPSIDLIRLFSLVEARFDIEVFDGESSAERVATVGDLVALVTEKCRRKT